MPIGESISDQMMRKRLTAQALCAAGILQEEWLAHPGMLRTTDVLAPGLLCRIARFRKQRNLDPEALGALVLNEAKQARHGDLRYLTWFTREAEMCLVRHTNGLHRYLVQQRSSLPKERRVALLFFGISLAKDLVERGTLVSLLAAGYLDAKLSAVTTSAPTSSSAVLTQNQTQVLSRLVDLADAHFAQETTGAIRPRLFPLIVGPTGAGKTWLSRKAAEKLNATFVSYTVGDWIPLGAAADYEASLYAILAKVANNDRVVLCLDEVDKIRLETEGTWGRSVASDIWRVLDLNMPVAAFLKSSKATLSSVDISEDMLSTKIASSLWIVGAGTWQTLHEAKPQMGFAVLGRNERVQVTGASIAKGSPVPTELMMRFHPSLLHLSYPNSAETTVIYRESGLAAAAVEVGLQIDPSLHDWSQGGMRSLEALWGEIAIRRRKKLTQAFYE